MTEAVWWHTIEPKDAVDIQLPADGIIGPISDSGEVCPWPWDPQQLKGAALGQYHCPYCGSMVLAGVHHPDYRDIFLGDPNAPIGGDPADAWLGSRLYYTDDDDGADGHSDPDSDTVA